MALAADLETVPQHPLLRNRYRILIGTYLVVTSFFFYRVYRQPFSRVIKSEQYETIFKGTTLAAVIIGVSMSSTGKAKYQRYRKES
ncbi:hypothetical protein K445DRAFT_223970 [Daldinia sp. EC12]|nr:hypothetical protein K445DRAFT_223970 [Daldinia sp. EC12]